MKKSLIALAVAGAFAVPTAAMAVDVSFGGEFDVAIVAFDDGTDTVNQMENTHSRFWWDMVDDLGTGLKVKGHLELDAGAVNGHGGGGVNGGNGSGWNNRNSFIGLAGDTWGEVRFGTQENGYEAIAYSVDPFHGAAGPGGALVNGMGASGRPGLTEIFNGTNIGGRRTDSTITYLSPNWSGFNFQVDYSLEGPTGTGKSPVNAAGTATTGPATDKSNELYIAAKYEAQAPFGGWRVYGGIADISNATGNPVYGRGPTDMEGSRFGGGVTWNNLLVDLIIESNEWQTKNQLAIAATAATPTALATTGAAAQTASKTERDVINLNVAYLVPTGKIAFGYTMMDDYDVDGVTCGTGGGAGPAVAGGCASTNIAVGYYHTLSANSSLYAIYDTMDNDANAQTAIVSGGTSLVGADPSSISLGMYLVF